MFAPMVRLSEIALSITDGDHQAPPKASNGIPFLTIAAINDGRLAIDRATRHVPESYFTALKPDRKPIIGDVLFSVTGSIAIPAIVDDPRPFTFQRHIAMIRPNPTVVDTRYLWHTLQTVHIKEQAYAVATGTAQLTIPISGLRNFLIPLPSLSEQRRIVAKLDSLSAKSNRSRDHVDHTLRLVEKYKQAILAAAFRGGLTFEFRARETNAKEYLRELEAGRRSRWLREEKRKQALRGSNRSDAELLMNYQPADFSTISEGPVAGWHSAPVGCFGFALGGKRLPKGCNYAAAETPFKYLRVKDFADGAINRAALKCIDFDTHKQLAQYVVEADDVLTSIAGTIGATCIVPKDLSGINLTENAAKIILSPAVWPRYIDLFLRSDEGQELIAASTVSTGQPKLALFRIEALRVPLAPLDEQIEITRKVEMGFAWIDRLASEAISARKLIDHLDQAILAKAIRGELVPQDPNDEPARTLLERIKVERASNVGQGRRRPARARP